MAVLPRLTEAGLVLLLAWLVAGLFVGGEAPNISAGFRQSGQLQGEVGVSVESVLKAAPFGKPAAIAARPVAETPKVAAPSKLNIKLHGTVVTDDQPVAMVIPRPGAALEVYHIGDAILPGVILSAVEAGRIVVETASGFEEIWLEESAGKATGSASRPQPAKLDKRQIQGNQSKQRVSRNMLNDELKDLGKLMTQVRVTPYFEAGQSAGFKVSGIAPGSIFERIGLLNGDVIKSINGQLLTDPQQAMQMYQQLQNASQLNVALLRNQQAQNIQYQIQ